jgi:hypothetical protein
MVEDSSRQTREESSLARSDALIDEAGEESFPASDPPATWSGEDLRDVNSNPGSGATRAAPVEPG